MREKLHADLIDNLPKPDPRFFANLNSRGIEPNSREGYVLVNTYRIEKALQENEIDSLPTLGRYYSSNG